MQYDSPEGLETVLARNAPSVRHEFIGLGDVTRHPVRSEDCLFCDYGASRPADKARIIHETRNFLLIDRPYSFDEALNLARKKNAGMSFLHILVLPKQHIPCVATIPNPKMIDWMHKVFADFLSANADMETTDFTLYNGQTVRVTQSRAIITLLKREWAKLLHILQYQNEREPLSRVGLCAADLEHHFASHARALSGRRITAADFATYFHVPPSIWHLHMHVALADRLARAHSTGVVDRFSMDARDAQAELQRMQR